MRTLHVEAQYLFMCNNSNMIYDVYIKDEADKEIERLRKIIKTMIQQTKRRKRK